MTTTALNPREKMDWKDLDLFDSDLEKAIVLAAERGEDPDWDKRIMAGEGLHLWRIEQLVVKPWGQHGKFYKGDCYLILKTDKNGLHDIHIWVGSESSRDEYAAAAYKMINLDERIGGTAVQHKEVQGKESIKFLQYFKNSVTYLEGGVASGTVDQEQQGVKRSTEPRLYRIKGTMQKNTLRLEEVPLRRDSLNDGDVFVLSVPPSTNNKGQGGVWLWRGKSSNPDEKKKGMEVAESFCPPGKTVTTLDQGFSDDEKSCTLFWTYLPGKVAVLGPIRRSIHIQEADGKDDKAKAFVPTLYEIRSPDNKLKKVCKARGIPVGPTHELQLLVPRSKLKTERAYLFDTGFCLYIWWGLLYTGNKGNGESLAQQYLQDYKRPSLPVTVLKERQEVPGFSQHFHDGGGGCACIIQ